MFDFVSDIGDDLHAIAAENGDLVVALVGILWVIALGGTGGTRVHEHAVNVRGVDPLPLTSR